MILADENWHFGYEQILSDCLPPGDGGSVWILCNVDVDAMAAGRILSYMLRSDNIPYQLRPCWSYASLTKLLQAERSHNVRALVLINIGATRNLTKLFDDNLLTGRTKIYVFDSHKPVHLANVHAGQNIVLFGDDTQSGTQNDTGDIPSDGDNLSGDEDSTDEEDNNDSDEDSDIDSDDDDDGDTSSNDGEAEFQIDKDQNGNGDMDDHTDADSKESPRKKLKSESGQPIGQDDDHSNIDDNDVDNETEKDNDTTTDDVEQQQQQQQQQKDPRELHRHRRDRIRVYYSSGSFFGSPVSFVLYMLASQKRFGDIGDLLWLACVGVADASIHNRIDAAGYAMLSYRLKQECQRLFPADMVDRVGKAVYAETLSADHHDSSLSSGRSPSTATTQVTLSENGRIIAQTDYRFFLLRHTSLLDSMMYSNFVSTRLQVWNNKGKQQLHELLAKMGFPLEECRQPYAFLKPRFRRILRTRIEEHAQVSPFVGCAGCYR